MSQESIAITIKAQKHLKKNLALCDGALAFLLLLKPDGCSGYQFDLKPINSEQKDAILIENLIYVSKKLYPSLEGLIIGLETQANFGYKLKFDLPQATDYCGCGKSFKVELAESE